MVNAFSFILCVIVLSFSFLVWVWFNLGLSGITLEDLQGRWNSEYVPDDIRNGGWITERDRHHLQSQKLYEWIDGPQVRIRRG